MTVFLLPLLAATEPPPIRREFRAAWVATVDNIDWPSKRGLPTGMQRRELRAIIERAAALRLNALVFQIRPSADALYPSPLEPWSEYLTGRQGRAPSPKWDPLAYAVEESHRRGIELHVWLNPYRANHPSQRGPIHPTHVAKTHPEAVVRYGKYLWMDPGQAFVKERTLAVVRDVVRRYDLDGVHIDDYFYPYPEGSAPFPDEGTYRAFGGGLSRADWRRKNVDDFVRDFYATVKRERRSVRVGISPFGIYRPGVPAGIKAGIDQYDALYADARRWLREGWCDYFSPQLYWPVRQTPQAFPVLLRWWLGENTRGRHVWPGLFTSRAFPKEGNWRPKEILEQIALTRTSGANGAVHFSMKALMQDANGVADALRGGPYAEPAIPPATPWLDDAPPAAPLVTLDGARVRSDGDTSVFWTAVQARYGNVWTTRVLPGDTVEARLADSLPSGPLQEVAVTAFDRLGVAAPTVRRGAGRSSEAGR